MDYCAYCGAKMQETADSCPVCGKWRRQVQLSGGAATVREPQQDEKTRVFDRDSASAAAENRRRLAEQAELERQARRAEIDRQPRYLQNDDPRTQPDALYDPAWNNEDYWQSLTERPYPPRGAQSRDRQTGAATQNRGGYERQGQSETYRGRQPISRQQAASGQRQAPGQRQGPGRRSASEQGAPRTRQGAERGSVGKPAQGSGAQSRNRRQRQPSAMRQLQADVAPAMREVGSRVRKAADGVAAAVRDPDRNRRVLSVAGVAVAALLVLLLIVRLVTGGGEKAVLKKLARAYEAQKPEAVEALSSDLMKALYPGDQLAADCRNTVGTVKDYFSERLGSSYRMSYKIKITETITGAALSQQMESNFGVFGESYDMSRVKEMTKATLTLKAKHGHTAEKRIQVILVKEDGKWKLASQNL